VRRGDADVGLIVRRDGRPLDDLGAEGAAPLLIVGDPGREIAITMLAGALQKAYFAALPDAAVRSIADLVDRRMAPFNPEQKARIQKGLEAMRAPDAKADPQGFRLDKLFDRENAVAAVEAAPAVTYYAGGVAMLFLLFSALTGAMSFLEERESGLLDRLATSPGGVGVLIDGKFLFLILQGFIQVLVIYIVAWAAFGVALPQHAAPWALTSLVAAVAAAGLAMGFVTLCRSKQQAQTLGQMLILIVSAVGGSMVPRYLMPPPVQALGWATPNTWALEAYASIFSRADNIAQMVVPWCVLAGIGLSGLFVAHIVARRAI
jgi:ABC-2 type transport system permease protein